jgi:hypothetical protein
MSVSSSEYLRRRMEATPKRIAPTPIRDASQRTEILRFKAAAAGPRGKPSGGQRILLSSEGRVAAAAGCGICGQPEQVTVVKECCPMPVLYERVPGAIAGSCRPCGTPGPVVYEGENFPKACCPTPGHTNTIVANDVDMSVPLQIRPCVPCRLPEQPPCCDEDGCLIE